LPAMHGQNYLEIVALMRDGLNPLEAWHASTGLAAPEIGQPDTGTVQAGKRADLLVFREDVVDQPDRLSQEALLEVIKDGVAYRGGCAGLPRRTYGDTATEFLRQPE
jgi:imidazolonepropionase-like amidohydrolase